MMIDRLEVGCRPWPRATSPGESTPVDGDVIVVAPGTYGEAVNLRGKDVVLMSSGGAKATILDGASLPGSQIRADSGETATIRGFTFRNGRGTFACACGGCGVAGGAIFINNSGLTVADSVFENNGSPDDVEGGGAIFACNSRLSISGSTFTGNHAAFGGAVDADLYEAGMLTISDTRRAWAGRCASSCCTAPARRSPTRPSTEIALPTAEA